MTLSQSHQSHSAPARIPFWVGVCVFAGVALFFLWEEHRAHLFGALPYLLLLLCPLAHTLMHGSHGGHGPSGHERGRHRSDTPVEGGAP